MRNPAQPLSQAYGAFFTRCSGAVSQCRRTLRRFHRSALSLSHTGSGLPRQSIRYLLLI